MGRTRKYSDKAFYKACDKYFSSISAMRPAKELYDTGRVNKNGMPVQAYRDATDDEGNVIMTREYFIPPSMLGLYIYLKITKQTASEYRRRGGLYELALNAAELRVEEYKARALNEGVKRPQGLIFDLQCNHGWGSTKPDDISGGGVIIMPEINELSPLEEDTEEVDCE